MSRSNPNTTINSPCSRYFEWNSDTHQFKYYDKELDNPKTKKKGMNVLINLPFTFIVLDQLTTIKGFNDEEKGIWSNEVRNLKTEPLTIRVKKGIVATGLYSEELLKNMDGAKYSKSVYIAYFDKAPDGTNKLNIGNIQFNGASVGAWIELNKQYKKLEEEFIAISAWSFKAEKKGKVDFTVPVFKSVPVTEKTNLEATELDKVLQIYLTDYFKKGAAATEEVKDEFASAASETKASSMPENSFIPKPPVDNTQLANAIDAFVDPGAEKVVDPFNPDGFIPVDDLPF